MRQIAFVRWILHDKTVSEQWACRLREERKPRGAEFDLEPVSISPGMILSSRSTATPAPGPLSDADPGQFLRSCRRTHCLLSQIPANEPNR